MAFLKRVGEGISIGVISMLFPFKHPALFLYPLCSVLVAIPFAVVASVLPGALFNYLMSVVITVITYFFMLGLVRSSIARMKGGTIKFWEAMALDGSIVGAFVLFAIANFFIGYLSNMTSLDFAFSHTPRSISLLGLIWCLLVWYFFPVVAYETQNFFDAIGRSVRYFFQSWIEVWSVIFTLVAVSLGIVFIGLFLVMVAGLIGLINIDSAVETLEPLKDMALWKGVQHAPKLLIGVFFILSLLGWILATGFMVTIPALYFYITNKLKNPFTYKIGKK